MLKDFVKFDKFYFSLERREITKDKSRNLKEQFTQKWKFCQ